MALMAMVDRMDINDRIK